ncbi:MAG: hypothetical protein AAGJ93_03425, partial [Bacteroidota bacterium]
MVSDRFGNCYTYQEIKQPNSPQNIGAGGGSFGCADPAVNVSLDFFELTFQDCIQGTGIGFDANGGDPNGDKRKTVCRAFAYLETLIEPNQNPCNLPNGFGSKVAVDIRISDHPELPETAGAAASAYYPYNQTDYGTITGFPWQVINGDVEEFEFLPLAFHGYIMFRASSSSQVTFNGWYTDENTPIPSNSNQFDLFSVTLHEAMHMLGFSSNLGVNGAPVQTFSTNYDRFDSFLQLDNGTPVITNNPVGSYDWQLNVAPTDLHQSCQGSSSGPDMVFQPLSGAAVPLFTGANYIGGSSFAHLGLDCDGTTTAPFVMRPSLSQGEATPALTPEELQILCSLGYSINGTCDCELAGVDDYGPACTPD